MYIRIAIVVLGISLGVGVFFNYWPERETVIVKTPFGDVKGYEEFSRDGRKYWGFKGIPFAEQPIGKLRFKPPVPLEGWNGTLDAKYLPPPCTQFDNLVKRHMGQENCLYLNIYTPWLSNEETSQLPIMVFVHGGSFLYGSSHVYGPEYFMNENVILVTVHYRLGILGFLNTDDDTIIGNNGLKDIVEALRFIQKSVSSFGGDSKKVTIFGESAGGACVHYLMLSNQTKGLFSGVVAMSGSALSPWSFIQNSKDQAFRVGTKLGCGDSTSSEKLLQCLQKLDARKFSEFHEIEEEFWSEKFGPSVEYPVVKENIANAFLLEPPSAISKRGNYNKVPWVQGVVSHEGCILAAATIKNIDRVNTDWKKMSSLLVISEDNLKKSGEVIQNEYFGTKTKFNEADLNTFQELYAHRHFHKGLKTAVDHQVNGMALDETQPPLFLYYFTYPGRSDKTEFGIGHLIRIEPFPFLPVEFSLAVELLKNWVKDLLGIPLLNYGVCHADDLKYLFQQNSLLKIGPNSPNYKFSQSFVKKLVLFASNMTLDHKWKPVGIDWKQKESFYEISGETSSIMINYPFDIRKLQFWNKLNM